MSSLYRHGNEGISALIGVETTPGTEAGTIATKLGGLTEIQATPFGYAPRKKWTLHSQAMKYSRHGEPEFGWKAKFFVQNWQFLYYVAGGHAVSGSGPYDHTLSMNGRLPSYSAELVHDDLGWSKKILGSKCSKAVVSMVKGQEIEAETEWIGMSGEKETSPQASAELATDPWMFDQVKVFTVDAVEKLDVCDNLKLTFDRQCIARTTLGLNTARWVAEQTREVSIEGLFYINDTEFIDLVTAETEFVVAIECEKLDAEDELVLSFPKCKLHTDILNKGDAEIGSDVPLTIVGDPSVFTVWDSIADYTT